MNKNLIKTHSILTFFELFAYVHYEFAATAFKSSLELIYFKQRNQPFDLSTPHNEQTHKHSNTYETSMRCFKQKVP